MPFVANKQTDKPTTPENETHSTLPSTKKEKKEVSTIAIQAVCTTEVTEITPKQQTAIVAKFFAALEPVAVAVTQQITT